MREIKFRAWSKEYNNMQYIDDMIWFEEGMIHRMENNKEYDFMQYTGLHDKNGKEIYEGDIVKAFINGIWYIGQIIYEHSGFTIDVTNNKQLEFGRRGIIERFTEVIGNIYDNPELLGGD